MAKLQLILKTWSCDESDCSYKQDFEPTPQAMRWQFVDGEPFERRKAPWINHDWNVPACPSCLLRLWKTHDKNERKLVTSGKKAAPEVFESALIAQLTPETEKPISVVTPSDEDIDSQVLVDIEESGKLKVYAGFEADHEDIKRANHGKDPLVRIPVSKEAKDAAKAAGRVAIQELIDRGLLDEKDAKTKAIKDNLVADKLSDVAVKIVK